MIFLFPLFGKKTLAKIPHRPPEKIPCPTMFPGAKAGTGNPGRARWQDACPLLRREIRHPL